FEGARESVRRRQLVGGHSGGGTPLPIPNRAVKPASADGTRGASPRESRTPPTFFRFPVPGARLAPARIFQSQALSWHRRALHRAAARRPLSCCAELLRPLRIERA